MYQRNNIGFRRVSASHFVSFYQAKQYMLGEILDSDKHSFSPTAREILLQYFSVMDETLRLIEQECIKRKNGLADDTLHPDCAKILRAGLADMQKRIRDNPSDFEPAFANIWMSIVDSTVEGICLQLADCVSVDIYTSFGRLVTYCIGYLNHILYVLHEIDYLLHDGRSPFMYVDQWDLLMQRYGVCTNEVRLNAYKEASLVDRHLIIKSELDDNWLEKDSQRIAAYQYAVDLFHRNSIRCEIQRRS